ncbi:MAG: linear amide C-N hydrolase [Bacteroidota bacterium]
MKKPLKLSLLITSLLVFTITLIPDANACTRVVYKGTNGTVITARSMDWKDKIPANIWIFPRGMKRNGEAGTSSLTWTSKYGSVIASAWDIATADGMNEKGLVANVLWLAESKYPEFDTTGPDKGLSIAAWAQYVLDNFATVDEAVTELSKEEFVIVSEYIPGTDKFTTLHLSISDASGDNAIFEYIDGKLVIHHSPAYQVMTNSPIFEKQLAINTYWEGIPGTIMLPGTNRAADRFVRASYYIHAIPQTDNTRVAIASTFSVIRNCSVPFGISSKDEPNISSTRWRSVSDHKNLVYYFETVLTPNTFWIDMKNIDFSENTSSKKLILGDDKIYDGDMSGSFIDSAPFEFAGL